MEKVAKFTLTARATPHYRTRNEWKTLLAVFTTYTFLVPSTVSHCRKYNCEGLWQPQSCCRLCYCFHPSCDFWWFKDLKWVRTNDSNRNNWFFSTFYRIKLAPSLAASGCIIHRLFFAFTFDTSYAARIELRYIQSSTSNSSTSQCGHRVWVDSLFSYERVLYISYFGVNNVFVAIYRFDRLDVNFTP